MSVSQDQVHHTLDFDTFQQYDIFSDIVASGGQDGVVCLHGAVIRKTVDGLPFCIDITDRGNRRPLRVKGHVPGDDQCKIICITTETTVFIPATKLISLLYGRDRLYSLFIRENQLCFNRRASVAVKGNRMSFRGFNRQNLFPCGFVDIVRINKHCRSTFDHIRLIKGDTSLITIGQDEVIIYAAMGDVYVCASPSDAGVGLAAPNSAIFFGRDLSAVNSDPSAFSVGAALPRLADGGTVHRASGDDLTAMDRDVAGVSVFRTGEVGELVVILFVFFIKFFFRAVATDAGIIIIIIRFRDQLSGISRLRVDG